MKKIIICMLALLLACAPVFAGAEGFWGMLNGAAQKAQDLYGETIVVEIDIQGYGVITAELYPNVAPITVENFVKLVNEGFYNGLTFHRIIDGFMIQGGDPKGNGTGGSSETITGEFSANGIANPLLHERGVLSMARSSMPNSASSQFFIMHEDAPHLDGSYAAFGRVIIGMEVVDAICAQTPVTDGNGTVAKENQPVINFIRVVEPVAE
nr:peptidylprolyl isomerase [Clostridia bacterium]